MATRSKGTAASTKEKLSRRVAAMKTALDAMPGASGERGPGPAGGSVLLYKVMGKTFAILSVRGIEAVSLKCDPHMAEVLREQYEGVGHRYHLDRRHWISVSLDADVPAATVKKLAAGSYDLVRSKLTKKQLAELDAL